MKEVEVKCPHCGEKNERTTIAFGRDIFIYECDKCKKQYKVEYKRIPTTCCKYEYLP
jgi:transposase-like protein